MGHTNSPLGTLSDIAVSRADEAVRILTTGSTSCYVIPTGGFGKFNATSTAHAQILANYLIQQGVKARSIIPSIRGASTLTDVLDVKRIYFEYGLDPELQVVTSSFHVQRVRYIFERLCPDIAITFVGVDYPTDQSELASLLAHERVALRRLEEHSDWSMLARLATFKNQP